MQGSAFRQIEFRKKPLPISADSQMPLPSAQNNLYATVVCSGPLYFSCLKLPQKFHRPETELVAVEKGFGLGIGREEVYKGKEDIDLWRKRRENKISSWSRL